MPFYPSSSDGGFAVTDFFNIDSKYGSWSDLKKISNDYKIMSDIVLNHASAQSKWFHNFLNNKGEGKDFFLQYNKDIDIKNVTRARSHKLIQKYDTDYCQKKFRKKQLNICKKLDLVPSDCVIFGLGNKKKYKDYTNSWSISSKCSNINKWIF